MRMGEWNSVKDVLPDKETYVIGYCHGYASDFVRQVRFNGKDFYDDALDNIAYVSDWMYLPGPPKDRD